MITDGQARSYPAITVTSLPICEVPALRLVLAEGPVHEVLRLLAKRVRTHDAQGTA